MRSNTPDVRVIGVGAVTCLGVSHAATLDALAAGRAVRGEPCRYLADTPYAGRLTAREEEPDIAGYITDRRMRKFMSRHAELAAAAARQALDAAAPLQRAIMPERIGLYAGVGLAAVDIRASADLLRKSLGEDGAFSQTAFAQDGLRAIHPLWSFHTLANMPACIVSVLESIKGGNGIYTPWEDQTAFALVEAAFALDRDDIDCAVVVASDTPHHPASLFELAAAGHLASDEIAAPGAACLVLERPDSAPASRSFLLTNIRLILEDAPRPHDPLAPLIGRTVAAAPLLLAALAPCCNLPRSLTGSGGHTFSFEVA
jgi:3-oxoacyl-(acyl-carrier-protein) synthase